MSPSPLGFDPGMTRDAQRDEVRRRVCAPSALGITWWALSLFVPPQRRQAPSLAVTARARRRQFAV